MATFQDNRRRHNWKRFNNQMNNAYQFQRSSPYFDPYSQNLHVFCVILDTSMNITKHKSVSQKRRDEQQPELSNSRKSVCVSMPFYNWTDDDLAKYMPKHLHTDRPKLDHSSAEIYSLKEKVVLLKLSVTSLQTSLTKERELLRIAEEQVVQSTEQTSKLRTELNMATALKEMREETIEELKTNKSSLKQQLDASLRECHGLTLKLEHELKVHNKEMIQKLIRIQELEKQLQDNDFFFKLY